MEKIDKEIWRNALNDMAAHPDLIASQKQGCSLRRAIFDSYPIIKDLMDSGWGSKQICHQLRTSLGVSFSDGTFYNYVCQARRRMSIVNMSQQVVDQHCVSSVATSSQYRDYNHKDQNNLGRIEISDDNDL